MYVWVATTVNQLPVVAVMPLYIDLLSARNVGNYLNLILEEMIPKNKIKFYNITLEYKCPSKCDPCIHYLLVKDKQNRN